MEYLEKNQTLLTVFSQPKMPLNMGMYIANFGTKNHRSTPQKTRKHNTY